MKKYLLVALIFGAIVSPAGAAVTVTPTTDPSVPTMQGHPVAANVQTDTAAVVDLSTNYSTTLTTTDGSKCPLTAIRRGTSRWRCTLPAGGSVFYSTFALAATTYISAFSGSQIASVAFLTIPSPGVYVDVPFTCAWKGWGYYVPPPGCPPQG